MPERGQQENLDRNLQDSSRLENREEIRSMNPVSDNRSQDSLSQPSQQQQDGRSSSIDGAGDIEPRRGSSNRGFAAMDPERQRKIASEGGRAAHKQGVAHEWNRDEAREAGRKGGQKVSQNREHMSEIGRRGGQRSGSRRSRTGDEQ